MTLILNVKYVNEALSEMNNKLSESNKPWKNVKSDLMLFMFFC